MRIVFFLAVLAACGPAPTIETAHFDPSLMVDLSNSTKLSSGLYVRDLELGTGTEITSGVRATLRYTGWFIDGRSFDSNQTSGFKFRVGAGEVILGWDLGVPGMKVGGSRQLIIPPDLGYGPDGYGPIPGNAILVFDVSVVSVG